MRILITGGSRGIGLALADALTHGGNRVCTLARSAPAGRFEPGRQRSAARCDITSEQEVRQVTERLMDAWGGIDMLINNAARITQQAVVTADWEQWEDILASNLLGPMLLMKQVLPQMATRGKGIVVNMASMEAVNCTPGLGCYAASKAGLIALTRSCAREMAFYPDIIVAAFVPGDIRTDMNPDGEESVATAVDRFMEFLQHLGPEHSGKLYAAGRFLELRMV